MSSKIVKQENNNVTMNIEVPYQRFNEAVNKAYNMGKSKYNIQGFRKGKAPRKIIELNYGEGVFYEDAINAIFPEVYDEAIEEQKIEPVTRPSLDIEDIKKGEPVVFVVEVAVKPEVELGEYTGIEIEASKVEIDDEAIENELKRIQDINARLIEVKGRPVENKDIVVIDYAGFLGEEQFDGGTAKNQELEIGSESFIPGFEEKLIGQEPGEEVEIELTFPADYHSDKLAGENVIFKVTVHEIKEKELPKLDDDLAMDVSEFDTLDEFKKDIRDKFEKEKSEELEIESENKLVDKIIENAKMDIPQAMIEEQVDSAVNDFAQRLSYQGMQLEQYLAMTKTEMEDFREQFRENARKTIEGSLILEKIALVEEIVETEQEIEDEIKEIAESQGQKYEDLKDKMNLEDMSFIKDRVIQKKTMNFIKDNSKIK